AWIGQHGGYLRETPAGAIVLSVATSCLGSVADPSRAAAPRGAVPSRFRYRSASDIAAGIGRGAGPWTTSNREVFDRTSTLPSTSLRSTEPPPARRFRIVTE